LFGVFGDNGRLPAISACCAIIRACAEDAYMMTAARTKMLIWILLSALAASMTYLIFRGYLSPDLLLGFANSFSC
jgi:hypothetical protein